MIQRLRIVSFGLLASGAMSACQASQGDVRGAETGQQTAANSAATGMVAGKDAGTMVTNEQMSISQRFRSLDDYLAWLEQTQGPVDGPWYKQVRPGIYELQTGNLRLDDPGSERQTFTREELAKKFGFTE